MTIKLSVEKILLGAAIGCFPSLTNAQQVLPVPQTPFKGKMSISPKESVQDFP